MTTEFEAKYHAQAAAFREMENIHAREKKELVKDRQRIIQLCYDGQAAERNGMTTSFYFDKILGLLDVSGHAKP